MRVAAWTAILAVVAVGFGPPAVAAEPVTMSVTGPASINATAGRGTATYWATFTILDPTNTATSIATCRIRPDGKRDCDVVPLTPHNFTDGNWQVIPVTGGWQYRWRIGYYEMTPEECWTATFSKQPYRITSSARNPADVVLATATHTYKVDCSGLAGSSDGPKYLRVYAGRTSGTAHLAFYLLDKHHTMKSFKQCAYSAATNDYYDCHRYRLTRNSRYYTKYGWTIGVAPYWRPVGSSACAYIGRKWPKVGVQVNFYDSDLHRKFSLDQSFRLQCRG